MNDFYSKHINDEQIMFKYAKGKSTLSGKEFHEYHEILLFMGGEAEFFSEKIHIKLSAEKVLIIPQKSYHQFIIKGNDNEYRRCVLNFYDIPEFKSLIDNCMKDVFIIDVNNKIKYLFNKAITLLNTDIPENEKRLMLRSVLALLLTEISSDTAAIISSDNYTPLSEKCIEFINKHICENLSVREIAKELNVSVSSLTHSFKKDMNLPVYAYILKKKLILAQQKIASGEPATIVALECGFNDYSGFYKQYKKMFGISPSEKDVFFN